MYQPYADVQYYLDVYRGTEIPEEDLPRCLRQASRHIDTLTYNRIMEGMENLSERQQEVIREVCCLQADFEHENQDELNTILQGYSLNGASVQFGSSWNVFTEKGVAMKRDTYSLLSQTGLCCRLAR